MTTIAFRVRQGFVFTDTSGAHPRRYVAGETLALPAAVGDAAHQLERVERSTPPVRTPRKAAREASHGA